MCCFFSSVAQSCPTLCDPMDCSTPGFPVHHQLPELIQTHVHRVSDAIQPSHPLSSPSPPAFNLSQHQGLFSKESVLLIRWLKYWTLSMGFPRQEYWSVMPFPPPGHLSDPGIEPRVPALQADSLPLSHQGSRFELG